MSLSTDRSSAVRVFFLARSFLRRLDFKEGLRGARFRLVELILLGGAGIDCSKYGANISSTSARSGSSASISSANSFLVFRLRVDSGVSRFLLGMRGGNNELFPSFWKVHNWSTNEEPSFRDKRKRATESKLTMAFSARTKDYSDDWDAFAAGLKTRTTLDLTYYARNLVRAASRIEGEDDLANALFEKLTRRCRLVNEELHTRKAYAVPKTSMAERKRTLDELNAQLPALQAEGTVERVGPSDGARYDDPPIPSRPTALVPKPGTTTTLATTEELSPEEDDSSTEEILSPYKRFKINFENHEEDK